ncbi:ImmA/IrrE family metallo-endopeptidase [Micrococcus luteus]|uniref:ImmA/IrrE family metallo-endopeptidase n=1 Tax=Micrococcus luteus TaxID=1270 RepID=A0AAP3AJN9_MICLU|nr:ImmA/IrrE family metallo-endopeptidase [Micrococcus luteus]
MSMETQPAGLSNKGVQDYARLVGEKYSVWDDEGRADLRGLLDELGGRAIVQDGPESLHVYEDSTFTIFLPEFTSARRDRFTIAHEIGHYFLHYLYPRRSGPGSFGRGARNRAETEANVFASSLLMPEEHFRRIWDALGADAWKVARHFDVSPAAASVRAEVLGLG